MAIHAANLHSNSQQPATFDLHVLSCRPTPMSHLSFSAVDSHRLIRCEPNGSLGELRAGCAAHEVPKSNARSVSRDPDVTEIAVRDAILKTYQAPENQEMAHLLIRHKVADFDQWKPAYDAHQSARDDAGLQCLNLWCNELAQRR